MIITRRNYGSGHSYKINGHPAPGVTTILRQLPSDGLIGWAARTTAEYAVDHWDELAELPVTERLKTLTGASTSEMGAAGRRGTMVHLLAEQIVAVPDEDLQRIADLWAAVPEPLLGHVESYAQFLADHRPDPIAIELVVANRRPRYCGTADLVAHMHGEVWLLDLTTSKTVRANKALQTCAYRHAEAYTIAGENEPHPLAELGITRAGAVHIRADGYDLRPLDTGPEVWDTFRHLAWLHHHAHPFDWWVGEAIQPARAMS
jgi:hypothetical protein